MKKVWVTLAAVVALVAPAVVGTSASATTETVLATGSDAGLNDKWNNFGDTNGDWSSR